MEWVLLVFMFTPGGDFIDKAAYEMKNEKICSFAKQEWESKAHPMGVVYHGLCVTKDHWTGKKPMDNVPLDF